jgi:hypothetical protein
VNRLLGLILGCSAIACSENFPPASAVTDLRVVAARVDVEGEPGRANPSPGQGVVVSLLVIDQGAPPSDLPEVPALTPPLVQWAFVACIPQPTLIGSPICRSAIEPCEGCIGTPPDDPFALPVLRFAVPTEDELQEAEADSVIVQGAICADGPPSEDSILRFILGETDDLSPCEDPSHEGRFVTVVVPVESDPDDPNLHPQISSVTLNGAAWPPPYDEGVPRTAPRTGCGVDLDGLTEEARTAHPTAGSPASTINLQVTPDSLQPYVEGDEERIEEIQVSWLADGGGFESTFSFITEPARSVLTQWKPSSEAPVDGILVRFTFVIRDGRGGTAELERGLCILSPKSDESPP